VPIEIATQTEREIASKESLKAFKSFALFLILAVDVFLFLPYWDYLLECHQLVNSVGCEFFSGGGPFMAKMISGYFFGIFVADFVIVIILILIYYRTKGALLRE